MFSMNFFHFSKCSSKNVFFILTGLIGLRMQIQIQQEWTQFSLRIGIYNYEFSVEIRVECVVAIDYTYIQ